MTTTLERVAIFVDAGNVFHPLRNSNQLIDWIKMMKWLHQGRRVTFAGYFNSIIPDRETGKEKFYEHLKLTGFEACLKPASLIKETQEYKQSGVDVMISVKAMSLADQFDTMIIVSGDYDFLPLIEEMKIKGKLIEIVSFEGSMHPHYKQLYHRFIDNAPVFRKVKN